MRFRLVEVEGYGLAVACEPVSGNPAVHNLSAHDHCLATVVLNLGAGYARRRRRTLSSSKRQKAPYAHHHDKGFAIRHILSSLDWLTRNASRIWDVGPGEGLRHPERHLN